MSVTGPSNTIDNHGTFNGGLVLTGDGENRITDFAEGTIQTIVSNGTARDFVDNIGKINVSVALGDGDDTFINRAQARSGPDPASPIDPVLIVSGTVTIKMAPMLTRIYDQMPDPKWAVSMGSCANSGGPFRHGYHVVKGVDRVIPVDVYVPGCPPPPESLLNGLLLLQDQIAHFRRTGQRAAPGPKVD